MWWQQFKTVTRWVCMNILWLKPARFKVDSVDEYGQFEGSGWVYWWATEEDKNCAMSETLCENKIRLKCPIEMQRGSYVNLRSAVWIIGVSAVIIYLLNYVI